ncbi:Hypothetical protein NTJ_11660 [Nesidiocoris tenuis]|uniref:Uncharacterized protein n=1 Tax=Nesidiocoris tenuis TaxID=355587 RepID=A0ABN7B359_9HEMI|nr:Hypothetical protein NTJ_11660 [Nesidiocoris tenuis]
MCKMKLLLVAVSSMFTLVLGTNEYMTDKNINQMKLELATLMKEELYKVDRDFDFIKLQFTVAKTNKNIEKCARAPIKQERYAVRSAVKKKMGT